MTKTKHKIPTIMGGGCPEYNKMDKIRCKECNQLMGWNKPHICLQLFDRNWIKGEVTSVTKFWKDKEEFAPFYKDDLMSFKERHFEKGREQVLEEVEKIIDEKKKYLETYKLGYFNKSS